jgi:hypothetical protein
MKKYKLSKDNFAFEMLLGMLTFLFFLIIVTSVVKSQFSFLSLPVSLLCIAGAILPYFNSLKKVEYLDGKIFINDYFKKDEIEVGKIKYSRAVSGTPKLIEFEFESRTKFGKKIKFVPNQEIEKNLNRKVVVPIAPGIDINQKSAKFSRFRNS